MSNKIKFWKGDKSQYDELESYGSNIIYFILILEP